MAIDDLIALIPSPPGPRDAVGDWDSVENKLGIRYPIDFRQLVERYGTGEFFGGLTILNPLNPWCQENIAKQLKNFRAMRDAMELSWVIHPERPGLFPWGSDSNGNKFCWLTEGKPDEWPVVQLGHNEEEEPHRANVSITEFLINYSQNKYPEMQGGVRFEKQDLQFSPGLAWES